MPADMIRSGTALKEINRRNINAAMKLFRIRVASHARARALMPHGQSRNLTFACTPPRSPSAIPLRLRSLYTRDICSRIGTCVNGQSAKPRYHAVP